MTEQNSESLFYSDPTAAVTLSYSDLVKRISKKNRLPKLIIRSDASAVFESILSAIVHQVEIVLLDGFDSIDQLELESESASLLNEVHILNPIVNLTAEALKNTLLIGEKSAFRLTLFTSGTTGRPKSVIHSLSSLGKNLRVNSFRENDVWAFCYHPTHFAGIQVLLQAVANLNPLVYLFQSTRSTILKAVVDKGITNISATPSFLRLLLPPVGPYPSVSRITSGGERFDEGSLNGIKLMFPNAKVTNIYASTEAGSLLHSENSSEFTVPTNLSGFVEVKSGELLLHKSLLGESLKNSIDGEWFNTGDLVEVIKTIPLTFRFKSRKSELINVGGIKVNPVEVEAQLLMQDGILQAKVSSRSNSILGQIVVAEIVIEESADFNVIKKSIRKNFEGPSAPRKITQVEKLEFTRTGKLKRS